MSISLAWRVALWLAATAAAGSIKPDEVVEFYPTLGSRVDGGDGWEFEIHGCIYEPARRRLTLLALRQAFGLEGEAWDDATQAIFAERARAFLVDHERGKEIFIRLGERTVRVGTSRADGHFTGRVQLEAREAGLLGRRATGGTLRIEFEAVLDPKDTRVFRGAAYLAEPTGLFVVSDIDDTIKISQVKDRKALLRNTLLRPFEPVPGMAAVYQRWATNQGAHFHYVSASPWQLHGTLAAFLRDRGFPAGTLQMKLFRWQDENFLALFASPEVYKLRVIEPMLTRFPRRQFVFVGDSGERDPEIYAALARRHPQSVARICIRDLTGGSGAERYQTVFKDVPRGCWKIFGEAEEIGGVLE